MNPMLLFPEWIKELLEKYALTLIKGAVTVVKNVWDKNKAASDLPFKEYLKRSMGKYGKVKTIIYRTEPKAIADFFECPNLQKEGNTIEGNCVGNILAVSHFIIIQGTPGIGKTIFMKHLFVDEAEKGGLIPVYIELKDINSTKNEYDIADIVFQKLHDFGSTVKRASMKRPLQEGRFLFLLDGYDDISADKKVEFTEKIKSFSDQYHKNYFIISSRPCDDFLGFQKFTVLSLCGLRKEQAISLVSKTELGEDLKKCFLKAFDGYLYERYQSYASNPLLLNIMLLTFGSRHEIPAQLHQFYENAFETLYSRYDRGKACFGRTLKSGLSYYDFKRILAELCFITYREEKTGFSYDEIISILNRINCHPVQFDPEDYAVDLLETICILYREDFVYKFMHRSFQEYFAAYYLKELADQDMQRIGVEMVKKNYFRATHDSVFPLLHSMSTHRFEQNILLPLVIEFEAECENAEKYNYYFKKMAVQIGYDQSNSDPIYYDYGYNSIIRYGSLRAAPIICYTCCNTDEKPIFVVHRNFDGELVGFLYMMARYHLRISEEQMKQWREAEDQLRLFLIKEKGYSLGSGLSTMEIIDDSTAYKLIRKTWVGNMFQVLASLRETLEQERENVFSRNC